jgi:hypothetical protein
MKALFFSLTSFLVLSHGLAAHAMIPQGCIANLDSIIKSKIEFEQKVDDYLTTGQLREESVASIRRSQESVATAVALLCSGLRKIELQRSVRGRIGLISQKRAEKEAQKSYEMAFEYYNSSIETNL